MGADAAAPAQPRLHRLGDGAPALRGAGSQSSAIAYPLLVLALTGSPAKAGTVGFARVLPQALFGLLAGVAADRWNRKRVMIAADLVRASAIGALGVGLLRGGWCPSERLADARPRRAFRPARR